MTVESKIRSGDRGVIAKIITQIENDPKSIKPLLGVLFKQPLTSMIVGITGPAGAGKSSLIDKLITGFKKSKLNPAILAIDPTSHITGGAILGDRIRMRCSTDSGVYIRSIASRGATGAISHSIRNCIRVLNYAKFNPIIIESAGAGQTEVSISDVSDVTIVVFNPNTGDNIQTIKAGLTEIGDIYLVNKSDLPGALQLYDAVRDYVGSHDTNPHVLKTSAKTGKGISELITIIQSVYEKKKDNLGVIHMNRLKTELRDIVLNNTRELIDSVLDSNVTYQKYLDMVLRNKLDPFSAAQRITKTLVK